MATCSQCGQHVELEGVCGRCSLDRALQKELQAAEQAKLGGFPFGPYFLQTKIGEGGMGVVYKAIHLDQIVALKILPDRFAADSARVQRFEREAKAAISLSHPNLVKGFEFGKIGNRWYYAMEFVAGRTLKAHVQKDGCLGEADALRLALQMAQALEAIHESGLVHRDVKPENILLGEDGTAKLMDFGLVKSELEDTVNLTHAGQVMGSPLYMSPEQIQGKQVDIRTDIFSLGATLFYAVTGSPAFEGRTTVDVIQNRMKGRRKDLRSVRKELSSPLCRVIERMMAQRPKDRYTAPAELAADIEQILNPEKPAAIRAHRRSKSIRTAQQPVLVYVIVGAVALALFTAAVSRTTPRPAARLPRPSAPELNPEPPPIPIAQTPKLKEREMPKPVEEEPAPLVEAPPPIEPQKPPDPVDRAALWEKALRQIEAREYERAIWTLTELSQGPDPSRALGWRAYCYWSRNDRNNALIDARKALQIDSAQPQANLVLGLALEEKDYFSRCLASAPKCWEAFLGRAECSARKLEWESALSDLDAACALHPELRVRTIELRFRLFEGAQKFEAAVQECGEWIRRDPTSVAALLKRAGYYSRLGKHPEAAADYAKVLQLDPNNAEARAGIKEPTAPPAARPKPAKPNIRKRIESQFNASRKQVVLLEDGRVRIVLAYDFGNPKQLADFEFRNTAQNERWIGLSGTHSDPGVLLFKAQLTGDFAARVEFAFVNDPRQSGTQVVLRTTDTSNLSEKSGGAGVAAFLTRSEQQWRFGIRKRLKGDWTNITDPKSVPVPTDRTSLLLKRDPNGYLGVHSNAAAECSSDGFDSFYLRLVASDPIRVTQFEIQGTLDPDWVKSILDE